MQKQTNLYNTTPKLCTQKSNIILHPGSGNPQTLQTCYWSMLLQIHVYNTTPRLRLPIAAPPPSTPYPQNTAARKRKAVSDLPLPQPQTHSSQRKAAGDLPLTAPLPAPPTSHQQEKGSSDLPMTAPPTPTHYQQEKGGR